MKKNQKKKLVLAKETVRSLEELVSVQGAVSEICGSSYCPSGPIWTPCPEH